VYSRFITWLEEHQGPCFYKKYLGVECPGCGMQRAFIELLKGNFVESICLYPPLVPIIIMFIYLSLHLKFNFNKGALYLKIMFIFIASIILINFVLKLLSFN